MSGVGVIIKKDAAKKMLDEGWGTFRKVYEKGDTVRWCNEFMCVSIYREGNELCVNRLSLPDTEPILDVCSDPASALTYALMLMEGYNSDHTQAYKVAKKQGLERLIKKGAVGVSIVGEEYPRKLAEDFEEVLKDKGFPELTPYEKLVLRTFLTS